MAIEIERKFLVKGEFKAQAIKSFPIKQAYLSSVPDRSVRVRIKSDKGFLTIKGKANESGSTRFEYEQEISIVDAKELLKICEPGMIEKIRFLIPVGNHTFEVDEFFRENEGLLLAEIELDYEGEIFIKPDWLGEEVTGQAKYYNSSLSKKPYSKWGER